MSRIDNSVLTPAAQARIQRAHDKAHAVAQVGRLEADRIAVAWLDTRIGPDMSDRAVAYSLGQPSLTESAALAFDIYFGATAYEHFVISTTISAFQAVLDNIGQEVSAAFPCDYAVLTNLKTLWGARMSGREALQNARFERAPKPFWLELGAEFAKLDGADLRIELSDNRWWSIVIGGPPDPSLRSALCGSIGLLVRRAMGVLNLYDRSIAVEIWLDALHNESSHSSGYGINHLSVACAEYCFSFANRLPEASATNASRDEVAVAGQPSSTPVMSFRKQGAFWTISFEGKTVTTKGAKGLNYIAHLLRNPRTICFAADLVAATAGVMEVIPIGSAGTALDSKATQKFRARAEDLQRDLAEADRNNDRGRKEILQEELEQLSNQLLEGKGMGGRDRESHDDREKFRKSVSMAIERSIRNLRKEHPTLADHLTRYIDRGYLLTYSGDIDWQF